MNSPLAAVKPSHEELWTGLPRSNVYKQEKLTGWRAAGEGERSDETPGFRRRTVTLPADGCAALQQFLDATKQDFHTVMLGVYHMVLQWYLDDEESLIGCSFWPCDPDGGAQGPVMLRPSYVYAEHDYPIASVLRDVAQQRQRAPVLTVDCSDPAVWESARAPIFFYAGCEGACPGDLSVSDLGAPGFQERRVVVTAVASAGGAEVGISLPSTVSRVVAEEEFHNRLATMLSWMLEGCSQVGELKARLGPRSDIPYYRLEEMQRRVIALWARVLGISEDSLAEDSNYYEVGGTSLNAFRLLNRVRVEFERDISLWEVLENPTVEQFSRLLLTA